MAPWAVAAPAGAVAVAVYAVYVSSAYRSVPGGDAGELLSESCLAGVGHPPGYPLFLLLSRLALALPSPPPFFSPAGKVNHLCCVLGALTAGFLAAASGVAAPSSATSSVLGGLLFAFSPLVWEYSVGAEVFALNNCLCALLVYLTVLICAGDGSGGRDADAGHKKTKGKKDGSSSSSSSSSSSVVAGGWRTAGLVCCGALTCGLALANQHASLLFMPVLVPGVLWAAAAPGASGARPVVAVSSLLLLVAAAAVCFLVGLGAPYLHLLHASRVPRPGSWGDTSTWPGLLRHVLRAEYGTFQLGATVRPGAGVKIETAWERVVLYLQHTSAEGFHAPFPLAAVGAAAGLVLGGGGGSGSSSGRRLAAGLLVAAWGVYVGVWHCVLSNLPLATPMGYTVHARFWMQPHIPVCVLAGVGCAHTVATFLRIVPGARSVPRWAQSAAEVALLAAAGTFLVQRRHALLDRSGEADAVLRAYAHAALASLPPRALLAAHTDLDWNGARYLRACEGVRPDVTHVNFQLMPFPWFGPRQQPLYPNVTFPPLLPGVSTARASEGNALLVRRFLAANGADDLPIRTADDEEDEEEENDIDEQGKRHKDRQKAKNKRRKSRKKAARPGGRHPGGLYVDMQAINEPEIGDAGQWRGLVLLPWGTLYRVLGPLARPAANYSVEAGLMDLLPRHAQSHRRLRALQAAFPAGGHDARKFPAGSWEHAAYSVFYDAHYQLGLHYLTWAIEALRRAGAMAAAVPFAVDRLAAAADLLSVTLAAAQARGTVSSPVSDVHKNLAVCWMRLHAVAGAMAQHGDALREQLHLNPAARRWLVATLPPHELVGASHRGAIVTRAKAAVGAYVRAYPDGPDTAAFGSFMDALDK